VEKKYLITGCLIGMFIILLVYAPTQTQTEKEYDPWADINDDGKIDVKDIYYLASIYGTTGDPARNVTIVNFPLDEEGNFKIVNVRRTVTIPVVINKTVYVGSEPQLIGEIDVDGFRKATVFISIQQHPDMGITLAWSAYNISYPFYYIEIPWDQYETGYRCEIWGPTLEFYTKYAGYEGYVTITIIVYLMK